MKKEEFSLKHDEDLEKIVLSGLLNSSLDQLSDWLLLLTEEDFYSTLHTDIFKAIKKCVNNGDAPEFPLVVKEMGNRDHMADLAAIISTYTNLLEMPRLCEVLSDYRKRRKLAMLTMELSKAVNDTSQDIDEAANKLAEQISGIVTGGSLNSFRNGVDVFRDIYTEAQERLKSNTPVGTMTGFRYLDEKGGFQPTNLILICADSSQGKTAFSTSIALNIARNGGRIAFFSLEMDERQLMSRMMAPSSKISPNRIVTGLLSADDFKALDHTGIIDGNAFGNIFFDDKDSSTIDSILNGIRRLHAKFGIVGVFIDYLQIIPSSGNRWETDQERLASTARRLKNLAKELKIWICALSQLSRDKGNIPSVDRLRGSGQMNEAADITMMLWRPETYNRREGKDLKFIGRFKDVPVNGKAQVSIAKGRNVGEGDFLVGFDSATTHFFDIDVPMSDPQVQETHSPFDEAPY